MPVPKTIGDACTVVALLAGAIPLNLGLDESINVNEFVDARASGLAVQQTLDGEG